MKVLHVAGLIVGVVALMVAAHYLGLFDLIDRVLDPPIENAKEAGEEAAEEKKDELDQETDAEVAADSDVADEHDAERAEFDEAADVDEADAIDDLDRRLHGDLREGLQGRTDPGEEGAGDTMRGRADEGRGK